MEESWLPPRRSSSPWVSDDYLFWEEEPSEPRRPPNPAKLPKPSSWAGAYCAYAWDKRAFNWPKSGVEGATGAGVAGAGSGIWGKELVKSTTLESVPIAFSSIGSTWWSIPNLLSKS